MGAAGRDFHNFNVLYRDDPKVDVVAFTATQIPGIAHRSYPPELAGPLYPIGIPIEDEASLETLCSRLNVDQVVFAYSDITHESVMHSASRSLSTGANFMLLGPKQTMLTAKVPVISITAVRTGCGKSQISRWISRRLRDQDLNVAVLRHPMPYGDLSRQAVQRFATPSDLDANDCTNEEREEYAPYIEAGGVVYAGVDYSAILKEVEKESDIIIWDGGNNDFSFLHSDLNIAVVDALRPGQAARYHPGETVLRMANIAILNKMDAASKADIELALMEIGTLNPNALVVPAASPVTVEDVSLVRDRRVLIVEDGPTITHGGMSFGAGYVAAKTHGAKDIIDPRQSATPEIAAVYDQYPHIGTVLPAVGYSDKQLEGLRRTIENSDADTILIATPFDLSNRLNLSKPTVRAHYAFTDSADAQLGSIIDDFVDRYGIHTQ